MESHGEPQLKDNCKTELPSSKSDQPNKDLLGESKNSLEKEVLKSSQINAELKEERPLQELFPTFQPFIPDPASPHFIDLFLIKKQFLKYLKTNIVTPPDEMKLPYSKIQSYVGELTYEKELSKNDGEAINVIINKYNGKNSYQYVMKRSFKYFDKDSLAKETNKEPDKEKKEKEERIENPKGINNEISEAESLQNFLGSKYYEYILMILFSASPHSSKPISFDIILLTPPNKRSVLVTELFMEYEGESINIKFGKITVKEAFLYLKQIIQALNFLECYHIEHNDIKAENIIIKDFFGIPLLKLIDFDVSVNKSITVKPYEGRLVTGFSKHYVSPEIIIALNKSKSQDKDPCYLEGANIAHKSMIFSVGVLMLNLLKFFPDHMDSFQFYSLKTNLNEYEKLLFSEIDKFAISINEEKSESFFFIVKKCLSFNPDNRLSPNEFLRLLSNDFESKSIENIEEAYKFICESRDSNNSLKNDLAKESMNNPTIKLPNKQKITSGYVNNNGSNLILEEEKDISRANTTIRNLNTEIKKWIDKCNANEKELTDMKNLLEEKNKEIAKAKEEANAKEKEFKDQVSSYKREAENMSDLFEKKSLEIKKMITEITERTKEIHSINQIYKTTDNPNTSDLQSNEIAKSEEQKIIENPNISEKPEKDQEYNLAKYKEKFSKLGVSNVSECDNSVYKLLEIAYTELMNKEIKHSEAERNYGNKEIKLRSDNLKAFDKFSWHNESIYEGEVLNGSPNGFGCLTFKNGGTFYGKFSPNEEFSSGIYEIKNQDKVQICMGRFDFKKMEGFGIKCKDFESSAFNELYYGKINNWASQGAGFIKYKNGDFFDGEFDNDIPNGKGVYYSKNEAQMSEGNWEQGLKNGEFIMNSLEKEHRVEKYDKGNKVN